MLGAIAGDIIGSVFEQFPIKSVQFPLFSPLSRFTDDTVLTVAIADAILKKLDYAIALKEIPPKIIANVRTRLPQRFLFVIDEFDELYGVST